MNRSEWFCRYCQTTNPHQVETVERGHKIVQTVTRCQSCNAPKPVKALEEAEGPELDFWYPATTTYMSPWASTTYIEPVRVSSGLLRMVLRGSPHPLLPPKMLDASKFGWPYWAYPGLIVAFSKGKYVPYSRDGQFGRESDIPVGVLHEAYDLGNGDLCARPVGEGKVIQRYCHENHYPKGKISRRVKRKLRKIEWT